MKMKKVWAGEYRNIDFEIAHWGVNSEYQPKGIWNFYIYLDADKFPKYPRRQVWIPKDKNYMDSKILNDLEMHGGITFYEKVGLLHGNKIVKVGCDYAHYGDEGQTYNEEIIKHHVHSSIDKLYDRVDYGNQKEIT